MRIDRTTDFRSLVRSSSSLDPSSPKSSSSSSSPSSNSSPSSSTYPPPSSSSSQKRRRLLPTPNSKQDKVRIASSKWEHEFLGEAYGIYDHLERLERHLGRVRGAYLSTKTSGARFARGGDDRFVDVTNGHKGEGGATETGAAEDDQDERILARLENSRWLTDRERDEINLRTQVILRGCRDRVTLLEIRETQRQSKVMATEKSVKNTATTFLTTLLPSLAAGLEDGDESVSGRELDSKISNRIIEAHNASILWSLNKQLLRISEKQKEMQEERVALRMERNKNLGSLAAIAASRVIASEEGGKGFSNASGIGNVLDLFGNSGGDSAKKHGSTTPSIKLTVPISSDDLDDLDDPTLKLTPAQIQSFSSENAELLSSMSSTLSSVLRAESSLSEISQLQSSLVTHLSVQAETIDRLYDDTIASVSEVKRANVELKKAKERAGDARIFLMVFLVGSSLALLFVHWYKT